MIERRLARILRVDHAGEHGAVQIYAQQISIARWRCPDLLPTLVATLAHERSHKERVEALMPERGARPCQAIWLWSVGGAALGTITRLLGRRGIYVCTDAVERAVHRHLTDQIRYANELDHQLSATLSAIDAEEREHLDWAASALGKRGFGDAILQTVISVATKFLIWLSTRGDSSRLARELRQAALSIA